MAGKQLTCNVMVVDSQGNPFLLEAGSTVPSEYSEQVSDHCFAAADEPAADEDSKPAAKRSTRNTDSE